MKIGIIANPHKPGAVKAYGRLVAALAQRGIASQVDSDTAKLVGGVGLAGPDLAAKSDVVVVLGGDGTMLHALATLGRTETPVAGVNIGTLGFLTSCTDDELEEFCDALKSGDFELSRRTLISATVVRGDGRTREYVALNEAVLARGQTGRLVSMKATVDGDLLNRYRADGLIVATPTGSTAYSLSAGGPLISPSAGVFVITPICPHTLSQRSLVVDDATEIELAPDGLEDGALLFTVDGRDCDEIGAADRVVIRKDPRALKLVRLPGRSFYGALRQKLNWRGG
ncbi:NAD+ kinase [Haloferula luteola]|uniref:NAD kinase n=1 Tax=Haloferula luteola TaxID=595692 RepID=A0A840UZR6_9BACT|nr:NAD(+)/NADH kinase [Haloferula luteola]MBB5351262.1 NAD+ kinase [Haloferula luteola]